MLFNDYFWFEFNYYENCDGNLYIYKYDELHDCHNVINVEGY